jgi:hypothetical protein
MGNELGETCSLYRYTRNAYFYQKNSREDARRGTFVYIDGRIILDWILKK